jgi:hypothetical protein
MKGAVQDPGRTAIRCVACGHRNLAIDTWCARCGRYLDDAHDLVLASVDLRYEPLHAGPNGRRWAGWTLLGAALVFGAFLGLLIAPQTPLLGLRTAFLTRLDSMELRLTRGPGSAGSTSRHSAATSFSGPTAQPVITTTAAPTPVASPAPSEAGNSDQSGAGAATEPPELQAPPLEAAPAPPVPLPMPHLLVPPAQNAPPASNANSPASAVALFYQRVVAHDFDGAAALWTPRMLAEYPPETYIDQRFSATTAIDVRQDSVLSADEGVATVAVDLVEIADGQTRHWIGTWRVVASPSGWLLDQPDFTCCAGGD